MEPWQVIPSVNEGPYALKTRLGLTVNRLPREDTGHKMTSGLIQVSANHISVDELWSQQFRIDFPEGNCDDQLEMSREDLQFLDMVSQSGRLVNGHYRIGLPLRNKDIKMPNNCIVAVQRALHLRKKVSQESLISS